MISVAMTTYNGEKYLREQLDSLKNQTRIPDEIIICDDCSSDNTVSIIKDFIENNPKMKIAFCLNKKNVGYKENFRNAIRMTNGDIVFLCDQDDIWHNNKIEVMCDILGKNENILVLNSSVRLIDSFGKPLEQHYKKNTANVGLIPYRILEGQLEEISVQTMFKGNISPGCSLCFRAQIKELFFEHYTANCPHDGFINLLAAAMNSLYFVNVVLTDYRIHETNTIGLKFTEGGGFSREKRLNWIKCQLENAEVAAILSEGDKADKILQLQRLRYAAANDRCFIKWLKLIKYLDIYTQIYSLKQIGGDCFYSIF